MTWLDDSDAIKIQRKVELKQALDQPQQIFLTKTPQRDMSVLPIDPPLTLIRLIDLMKSFMAKRDVSLEVMDSGEEAFEFKFIELEGVEGDSIQLYVKAKFVKAKFGNAGKTLLNLCSTSR